MTGTGLAWNRPAHPSYRRRSLANVQNILAPTRRDVERDPEIFDTPSARRR